MTIQRPDPNRPLFSDMDDQDEPPASGEQAETGRPGDPLTITPAGNGAIPLGAPTQHQDDGSTTPPADEGDPRGR